MLAFVVTGAASIDAASADGGGKGGRNPGFERVGWLHVVVTIEQHRRFAGVFVVASHHHRPAGRGEGCGLEAQFAQIGSEPLGSFAYTNAVGTDTGAADVVH